MIRKVAIAVAALMLGAGPVSAQAPKAAPPKAATSAESQSFLRSGASAYQIGAYATALVILRPLADEGNVEAQNLIGQMYANGEGVPQNYATAISWYRKAAEQGNPSAQLNLGLVNARGQGVPQDYVQAHMWLNLAASRTADAEQRDLAVKARNLIAESMTPTQIAEAQRLASAWKPK